MVTAMGPPMMRIMNITCCISALAERRPWKGTAERRAMPCAGREEAGDDADRRKHKVEAGDRVHEEKKQAERGASEVARDERELDRPAIGEDAADDAEHGDGCEVGDLNAGDLLRCGVQLVGHDGHDGVEREEVAEDARQPARTRGGAVGRYAAPRPC